MAESTSGNADQPVRYAAALELIAALRPDLGPEALLAETVALLGRVLPVRGAALVTHEPATGAHEVRATSGEDVDWRMDDPELERLREGDLVLRPGGPGTVAAAPSIETESLRGWLALGLAAGDGEADDDARRLIAAAGRLLGLVLGSARHAADARLGAEEAEAVDAIARELGGSLELNEVVDRIAELAHRVTRKPVVLWLCDGGKSRAVSRTGGALVRLGEERELLVDPSAGIDPVPEHTGAARHGGRILVPLAAGSRVLAFMAVGPWTDSPPAPEQLRLLRRMAPHAASALENARLHEQVLSLSLTDPLVQLPNRRQLDRFLATEFAAAQRGRPLCLALYDLDKFKEYNDALGHHAGDEALIGFADVLRSETRAMNLAARYGGEEFVTVLSGTELAGARAHAERVLRRFLSWSGGKLSVSAGVAGWAESMAAPADLLAAADAALYRAKAAGRNRVEAAD